MKNHRVISLKEAKKLRRQFRLHQEKLIFTNGCFDILHIGHIKYLEEAKSLGDVLMVGINTDRSVSLLKGPNRPIVRQNDRARIISSLYCVDYSILFDEHTPEKLISELKPDVYVKGGDYKIEDLPESRIVQSYGGVVNIARYYQGKSTSNLIQKILNSGM